MNMPETNARLAADGAMPAAVTPAQFGQEMREESAMWARVIKAANIRAD